MKKMIAILLVVCLALGGLMGYWGYRTGSAPVSPAVTAAPEEAAPAATEATADTETPAPGEADAQEPAADAVTSGDLQMEDLNYQTMDLDRLYTTHDPEETVLTVNGKAENWRDYFYFLATQVDYVENFLVQMYANYGAELLWSDVAEGDSTTYADMAVDGAAEAIRQFATIEGFAKENGIELSEENREAIAQQQALDMAMACGPDATEADFEAYLASRYMSRDMYDRINTVNALYQEGFRQLYGENGEVLEDETALQYLEDNGYISASHILLMTVDPATGEKLDDAAIEEKAATAQRLAEELQAIADPQELLERFNQLKEEYCEDTGKTVYPAGYTFTHRTMVTEFEDACNALEPYEVSDPVQSSYGYHIIMRLPPDPDALLFSSSADPITARATAANAEYGQRLQAYMDGLEVEYAEGFEKPNLLDYING
ncbi:MAG: peptidylprolyl isomerase [Oscillospiraceae bacterium]|nr:peptidylprolyl isomerase [Oscillospiraceae bacterium]